jgi:hypothetical protein
MKFITAFLQMLTSGMTQATPNPKSRSRTPGGRNPAGAKIARMAKDHMITKRGRRSGGAGA